MTPGLMQAVAEVDERMKAGTCTAPTLAKHPHGVMDVAELTAELERQRREAADSAA